MEIIKLNLIPSGVNSICHCSQYDNGRVIRLELFDGLTPYTLQSGDTVTLNVRKPDNTIITASVTATQGNNYVDIVTTEQMCAVVGNNLCDLTITNGSVVIGTLNFYMQIERDVLADGTPSESVIKDLDEKVQEAVGDNYYTKTEVNTKLEDYYTESEIDSALALKANDSDLENFIDNTSEYITQMLDVNTKTSGKFYYPNNTTSGTAAGYCLFPPIHLTQGKTYTLVNIRPVFTNFKVGNTTTSIDPNDSGSTNKTIVFTPENDGDLYVTGGDSANVMVFDADYRQNDYIFGKFNYRVKNSYLGNGITELNCTFFKKCEQLLRSANASDGYWNKNSSNEIYKGVSTSAKAYEPIKLKAGVTYRFVQIYGYFTLIADLNGNFIERLTDDTANRFDGEYTPSVDRLVYVSVHISVYESDGMLLNDNKYLPEQYIEGIYYTYLNANTIFKTLDIHVKQDGSGDFTSVVDAVNFANNQHGNYPINIYVHTGDYDILDELGGDTFLASVLDSVDERQGLGLRANNINLIGVGLVILRYELPDTVTYYQSSRTSCLNLCEFTNSVENLTLIAKNCRYTIHDEANNGNRYLHRVMKNLRCIHKGNINGLWEYPTVMGGGAGGGSTYDVINCQFITSSHYQAFSYHSGANQEASMFNIDGCVGSVNANLGHDPISFRLSYHGENRKGISVGNIKSCSGNGQNVVQPEAIGDTDNNIEMYVNGWQSIDPIIVSGNE